MKVGWIGIAMFALVTLAAASPRVQVKAGNRAALQGQGDAAMVHYKKALEQKGDSSVVLYDLGNLLYSGGDYDNASKTYMGSYDPKDPPAVQGQTFYNLGNSLFEGKKYDQALEAYLKSLKRNPQDEDARYNLELTRRMLKQQQQQQQDQKKDDQKKDNQKEDQQQQQDQQDQQQQDEQQQEEQQAQQDQQNQDQQQPMAGQQMSKEDAERLLNSLLQDEQDALRDAKKVKVVTRAKREKDW